MLQSDGHLQRTVLIKVEIKSIFKSLLGKLQTKNMKCCYKNRALHNNAYCTKSCVLLAEGYY